MSEWWADNTAEDDANDAAAEAHYAARYEAKVAIAEESGCEVRDVGDEEADELLAEWAATGETEASLMPGRV